MCKGIFMLEHLATNYNSDSDCVSLTSSEKLAVFKH